MKFLIILLLLLVLIAIIAVRYRRQIQTAIYMLRMFKKMREMGKSQEKQIETKEVSSNAPLVKCSNCGTWITQNTAFKLRSNTYYCSSICMEKAVNLTRNQGKKL